MTKTNVSNGKLDRAIIIGGGIAGLFTAKVFSDYYEEVLIVDKDDFPENPENRPGTPQAFQPHRLTPRGKMIMDRLFPGFNDELLAQGAPSTLNKKAHMINPFGKVDMINQENEATFSRALLEYVFRKRVKEISNVRFLPKQDVIGLQTNLDQTKVTGVHLRERDSSKQTKTLTSNMVVDTSGKFSKLEKWLIELGYTIPKPDKLKTNLGYSTRHYQIPSELAEKWDVIRLEGNPSKKEFTAVFSIVEDNRAEMLLWGVGEHYPPTKVDEFEQAISQLTDPIFSDIIEQLEPLSSPRGYRISELSRRRYDQMQKWPSGLLVLGDALCNFDPIYGLGMTMAAIEVDRLEECLREQQANPKANFEQIVLQKLQEVIEPAWWLNCVSDLQWKGVAYEGQPLQGIEFAQKYFNVFLQEVTTKQNLEQFWLYWGVNTVLFSPHVLINLPMVSSILAGASIEDKKYFTKFIQESDQSLEELINQIPSFSQASFAPFPPQG